MFNINSENEWTIVTALENQRYNAISSLKATVR
jgi:hypothetical protein